eukprot:CAMPEP_0201736032 /NCGR_PEP_ID=MMETSP0593-20130828/38629_1 /ASSEMBLY_ACC=CAM_ASM_000672 /TAXON_ID=267983 /ORGANISM="Skeletonema japonicum, Strain CCMP2506" /LENGTH=473 /DNA_ID=CAMNT_0048229695 /DNA_START=79 /DNA_END=1500 /DNA_ORIENTATION=+
MSHHVDFELPLNASEEEVTPSPVRMGSARSTYSAPAAAGEFGIINKASAWRKIRRGRKQSILNRRGWSNYDPLSYRQLRQGSTFTTDSSAATEETGLLRKMSSAESDQALLGAATPWEGLVEMFIENKINYLFVFIPFAVWSHKAHWSDGSIFILNFLAMVPLASMLGVFTEELAAHTNDVIGGLINATFGNAVELVVAIQALFAGDFRVVQASLIGSVFSNLLLVLGMCFLFGGIEHKEQEFIAQGVVASISLLGFSGVALLLPEFFDDAGDDSQDVTATISRLAALLLIILYGLLLWFQLKTHVHLFQGDDDTLAMIPYSWALTGLVVITAIVTILSEFLVASIDGFCTEFNLGRSFVGLIILPVVGNAVEHISAVSVAMKNKMDLALGVALGSSVQIALFVLPVTVVVGWFTGREMTMKFPPFEVALYLMSVIIVSMCLSNARSNWLEGSLLVSLYVLIAVGIYFEKDLE